MGLFVKTRENGEEIFSYNIPGFPVYAGSARTSEVPRDSSDIHWHDDFELHYVVSGSIRFYVDGAMHTLKRNQGIFINSRCSHYGMSDNGMECEYRCVLIHPSLFDGPGDMRGKFVNSIISDPAMRSVIFDDRYVHDREIITSVSEIFGLFEDKIPMLELEVTSRVFNILTHLCYIKEENRPPVSYGGRHDDALRRMLECIHKRYQDKLTLSEIAQAGAVGRNLCNEIFREYMGSTPIGYLMKYRLEIGTELLCATDLSISQIASMVGFGGQSYFSEMFRRQMGITPSQYRHTKQKSAS